MPGRCKGGREAAGGSGVGNRLVLVLVLVRVLALVLVRVLVVSDARRPLVVGVGEGWCRKPRGKRPKRGNSGGASSLTALSAPLPPDSFGWRFEPLEDGAGQSRGNRQRLA